MFYIGDRVILITNRYEDCASNPFWRGRCGKVTGEIVTYSEDTDGWVVEWSNGCNNTYDKEDLELYQKVKKNQTILEKIDNMYIT